MPSRASIVELLLKYGIHNNYMLYFFLYIPFRPLSRSPMMSTCEDVFEVYEHVTGKPFDFSAVQSQIETVEQQQQQ